MLKGCLSTIDLDRPKWFILAGFAIKNVDNWWKMVERFFLFDLSNYRKLMNILNL